MRRIAGLTAGFVMAFASTPAVWSADEPGREGRPVLDRIMKELDRDGDGALNDQERARGRELAEELMARLNRPPRNREGMPSMADILKRFDKDGDGKLSDDEKAEVRKEYADKNPGDRPGRPGPGSDRPGRPGPGGPPLEAMIERFDKDGDGKLSADEQAAAREAFGKMKDGPGAGPTREQMMKRFDKDGDGKLNEEEQRAARAAYEKMKGGPGGGPGREEMLKRFDKDGDGKLNEQEEQAAREAMARMRGGREGGLLPGEGKSPEPKVENAELLKKFDGDGDGKLNDEEKAAARKAFQNRDK